MTSDASPIRLSVLGAGPAYTDRAGAIGSAYLVRLGTTTIVLDLGQGAFTPLARELEASGLESEWPWGAEDPNWLDYKRLLVRLGTRGPFPE